MRNIESADSPFSSEGLTILDNTTIKGKKVAFTTVVVKARWLTKHGGELVMDEIERLAREADNNNALLCPILDFRGVKPGYFSVTRLQSIQQFMGPQVVVQSVGAIFFQFFGNSFFPNSELYFVNDMDKAIEIRNTKIEERRDKVEDSSGSLEP